MSFGKLEMKCHSDRKNVTSVIQQMSNLTEISSRENRSEGHVGTDFYFFKYEDLWIFPRET